MGYMLTSKALDSLNIEEVFKSYRGSYFHVAPSIPKIAVINLGMSKEDFMSIVELKYSVNVFDEDFSISQLKAIPNDAIYISHGKIDSKKLPKVLEKLQELMGSKTILGTGLGKDLIAMAIQQKEDGECWSQEGKLLKNEKYHAYACDTCTTSLQELFKVIN